MNISVCTMIDASVLARSYAYCQRITQQQARNFYYALRLVPQPKRSAMFALYAYMRAIDDVADERDGRSPQQRRDALENWRRSTRAALQGQYANDPDSLWPAICDAAQKHHIPINIFDDAIAGQCQDLEPVCFQSFDELREYCYRVAGTVGIASISIWGFEGGQSTMDLAIARGVAFQLTNILRDLREDLSRGRLYLPRQELLSFHISEQDLRSQKVSDLFDEFMRFQIDRARSCYDKSAPLEARIESDCRPALLTMTRIYRGLLEKIAADPSVILRRRVSLSWLTKVMIGWRALRAR